MKLKYFLLSFVLSIPFWLTFNSLGGGLENFWYTNELANNPALMTAQISSELGLDDIQNNIFREKKVQAIDVSSLDIKAKSALLIDGDRVIFEKDSSNLLPIASLSKLMTAYVVYDLYNDFSKEITISKESAMQEPSTMYSVLKEGEKFSIDTLMHMMLIESNNEAAYAITEPIGQNNFVDMMNLYAKDLGLSDTYFINSTGLDQLNSVNVSTSQDIVKLTEAIIKKHPEILKISALKSYEVLNSDGSLHHFIPENTNKLLAEVTGIIGGKTGFSTDANGCLMIVIKKLSTNGYFIGVVLGSEDRFGDMKSLISLVR